MTTENYDKVLETLEVIDSYEQCAQYDSIKAGIQAHAETYSFNIESELFHQLTKEQQALWRKEIEQACVSGGEAGVELARDPRYEENLETKDALIDKAVDYIANNMRCDGYTLQTKSKFIKGFKQFMKGE